LCLISGIEPADDSSPLPPSTQIPAVSHITPSTSLAAMREVVTSFPVPEAKDIETTLASELQLTAATGKTEFSAVTSNTTLPRITLSSNTSSQSTEMTSGKTTTTMSETTKSNVSLSSPVDISPLFPSKVSSETSTKIQPISSGSTKLLRATEPQTVTARHAVTTSTESESKPISPFFFTGTALTLRTTELPVKTKIMEISEIATRTFPTKEAQVKPEGLTTFTPSSFESITEKTTVYLPQFPTPPPVNLTATSEGKKISIGQSFTTVANVTVISFSPVITTLLKPASSATTKAAIVLTEQSMKTTSSPTSTPPVSLGKAITEPPIEMVQHLARTTEVPFTTTLGPKTSTLQTQERSSGTTLLSFTTHKKETPKTTSHVEHTSSYYVPPYSLHPCSTTEKSITLSTKRPSMSVPTPASPVSGEIKKTFETVSTTRYPSYILLNTTEFLTTLYTKYPVVAEAMRVTPLSAEVTSKITSPFELAAKSTLFSGKTSTKYKSTLVSSTVKTSTSAYSGTVTTSAMKTSISSKEATRVPFIATERESAQTTSITGSPLTLFSGTETTLLKTQPDTSQVERITSISTRKPSVFPFSPSSSPISLNISLPSLPSYGKEALSTATTSLHPRTTTAKSMLPTEKTSPVVTFSTLSTITEQLSPITIVSHNKSPGKPVLNITYATLSPSSEFSSQLITTKKVMTAKEKSTLSPSVLLPVTKSSYTFSTSRYLADKSLSLPSLTQMVLEVTTTPKYPVETAMKSTVQSTTDTVKLPAATAQPSFSPSSVGLFFWQTSSGDKLSVQTTKTMVIPHFSTQKAMELGSQTSEPLLTSQSSTPVYQYPAETQTKSTVQPQSVFSTTKATVGLTSSYTLITSLPEGIHSSILPTSGGPTQVILPAEKELHLTDSVTQPYVSRTSSALGSTVPTRTTAGLIFGTRILPSSPEVLSASSSLATIKKEVFPSFSTQKAGTGLKFTWPASFTESLESSQTLETTIASPESKSTLSSVLLPETREIPVVMGSELFTSMSKSGTEKTVLLPKQVTLSTTTYSSAFLASTKLSAMAHSSAAASGPVTISSTGKNINTVSATSGKAEAVTESITSSVKPTYFSVTSEAKGAMPPDTVKSEEPELTTKVQTVHAQGATITPGTSQTFYSPYFTNTTAVFSNVSISLLSTIRSSSEPKPFSSIAASSASTTQTSKLQISSEVQTPSLSPLLMISDHPNDTTASSVSSFVYLSTKPLYGLTTTFSGGLATAEVVSGVTASAFMPPRETATLQTCTVSNYKYLCLVLGMSWLHLHTDKKICEPYFDL